MNTPLLDQITCPQDLKRLSSKQVVTLCDEIRTFLVDSVSHTGGHLSSNLGAVELTVALHRVLNSPEDKFVFDVGHQCYTHKLLTGRREQFSTLRQDGGLSGFPNPTESEHDAFIAGHGNTALSLAIGMARAKKLLGEPGVVVALIGDGSFTGGMVYEGMNNVGHLDNLVVILNDNKMSISRNVGGIAHYLTRLRSTPHYMQTKQTVQSGLNRLPVLGKPVGEALHRSKKLLRQMLYNSTVFEDLGFRYFGPLDGHNVGDLEELLGNILVEKPTDFRQPVFLHVVTQKGRGFAPAERRPEYFHGVSSFDPQARIDPERAPKESFSNIFGCELSSIAREIPSVCAITAAMRDGTGLNIFAKDHPDRCFDVGMAEQHAVTFAAGLASQGILPVVAIYSTFLQRTYDQLIHDVNLIPQNVLLAIDRAGLVPGDGETHQGIYDSAFLSQIGIPTYSPTNYDELRYWLRSCVNDMKGPRAIRYPRGGETKALAAYPCTGNPFDLLLGNEDSPIALISYASEVEDVLEAGARLKRRGIDTAVYKLICIHPIPQELINRLLTKKVLLFAEECVECGGIGAQLVAILHRLGWRGSFLHHAVDNKKLTHATVPQLKKHLGLDADSLVLDIQSALEMAEDSV